MHKGRKIDLEPRPSGTAFWIEGRRHTEFDSLLPIECKRLPTPQGTGRDEREYVISRYSSTGGIQRFKEGNLESAHTFGAMIGYLQEETTAVWDTRVAGWINDLAGLEPGWTTEDLLQRDYIDTRVRLAVLRSSHGRQKGLAAIELRHLWLEMNQYEPDACGGKSLGLVACKESLCRRRDHLTQNVEVRPHQPRLPLSDRAIGSEERQPQQ